MIVGDTNGRYFEPAPRAQLVHRRERRCPALNRRCRATPRPRSCCTGCIALLVLGQFTWGWWMQEIPKQPVGPRVDAFNLHKSLRPGDPRADAVSPRLAHRTPAAAAAGDAALAGARSRNATHIAALRGADRDAARPATSARPSAVIRSSSSASTLPAWARKSAELKDADGSDAPDDELDARGGDAAARRRRVAKHGFAADGLLARMGIGPPAPTRRPRTPSRADARLEQTVTAADSRCSRARCRAPSCRDRPSGRSARRRRAAHASCRRLAVTRRPHQRSQLVLVDGVGIDAARQQQLDDRRCGLRRPHRSSRSSCSRSVASTVGALVEQHLDHVRCGRRTRRRHQRRDAVHRREVDVGAGRERALARGRRGPA